MYKNEESPEVLECLEEIVSNSLAKHDFPVPVAAEITSDVVSKAADALGGYNHYFPQVHLPPLRARRKKKNTIVEPTKENTIVESSVVRSALKEALNDSLTKHGFSAADENGFVSDIINEFILRYSGEHIYFARGYYRNCAKRDKEIAEALDNGVSHRTLARKYRLSERRIYQILKKHS